MNEAPDFSSSNKPAGDASRGDAGGVRALILTAQAELARARQHAWFDLQRRWYDAWLEMIRTLNLARAEANEAVVGASQRLMHARLSAHVDADAWKRYQEAVTAYNDTLASVAGNRDLLAQQNAAEACREQQRDASMDFQRSWREADQAYLEALRAAWAAVDVSRSDPLTIMALQQATACAPSPMPAGPEVA